MCYLPKNIVKILCLVKNIVLCLYPLTTYNKTVKSRPPLLHVFSLRTIQDQSFGALPTSFHRLQTRITVFKSLGGRNMKILSNISIGRILLSAGNPSTSTSPIFTVPQLIYRSEIISVQMQRIHNTHHNVKTPTNRWVSVIGFVTRPQKLMYKKKNLDKF